MMYNPTECEVKHIDCHPVPEPSALAMLGTALVVVFVALQIKRLLTKWLTLPLSDDAS